MINGSGGIYNTMGSCMAFKTPKQCTDTRTALIDIYKEHPNTQLKISICVPFEITEDFTEENSIQACNLVIDNGMKTYGGITEKFNQ